MGWLASLFGQATSQESQPSPQVSEEATLEAVSVGLYEQSGYSNADARKEAKQLIEHAKGIVRKRGWDRQPANYGDLLLQRESSDANAAALLAALRAEGVRDVDIREWWNRSPLDRVLVEHWHDVAVMSTDLECLKQGKSADEAAVIVKNMFQIYGHPSASQSDDRPLPIELHSRISDWTFKHVGTGYIPEMCSRFKTLNELVRSEIRSGRL